MNDTDLGGHVVGIAVAAVAVVSSGMQQILCRSMQQKHGLSSHELLSSTAPSQVPQPLHRNVRRMCRNGHTALIPRTLPSCDRSWLRLPCCLVLHSLHRAE